jgi:hypothetical protein
MSINQVKEVIMELDPVPSLATVGWGQFLALQDERPRERRDRALGLAGTWGEGRRDTFTR